jgi:hypothetical protein
VTTDEIAQAMGKQAEAALAAIAADMKAQGAGDEEIAGPFRVVALVLGRTA